MMRFKLMLGLILAVGFCGAALAAGDGAVVRLEVTSPVAQVQTLQCASVCPFSFDLGAAHGGVVSGRVHIKPFVAEVYFEQGGRALVNSAMGQDFYSVLLQQGRGQSVLRVYDPDVVGDVGQSLRWVRPQVFLFTLDVQVEKSEQGVLPVEVGSDKAI